MCPLRLGSGSAGHNLGQRDKASLHPFHCRGSVAVPWSCKAVRAELWSALQLLGIQKSSLEKKSKYCLFGEGRGWRSASLTSTQKEDADARLPAPCRLQVAGPVSPPPVPCQQVGPSLSPQHPATFLKLRVFTPTKLPAKYLNSSFSKHQEINMSHVETSLLAQDEEGAMSLRLLIGAPLFFLAAVARAYLCATTQEILILHKHISCIGPVPQPGILIFCLYRFRQDQSPVGDGRALLPSWSVLHASSSVATLSPFQLSAPSFCLFLSEGVDVGSRNTSDQLVINNAQYFSSKKLWRDSRKARIWLLFQKPGCRKTPFEITLLLPRLLLPTLWQEAIAPESVNLLSLLGQEYPWYKFITFNRVGPLIPSAYL